MSVVFFIEERINSYIYIKKWLQSINNTLEIYDSAFMKNYRSSISDIQSFYDKFKWYANLGLELRTINRIRM